jgi:hypothetical protein
VYPTTGRDRAAVSAQAVFGLLNSTPHSRMPAEIEMATLLADMASAALAEGCRPE